MTRLAFLLVALALVVWFLTDSSPEPEAVRVVSTSQPTTPPLPAVSTMRPGVTMPTTTTTAAVRLIPKARTGPRVQPTYAGNPAGQVNGYPCGGDLPPCSVLRCESGGHPTAQNPRSSASGLWQIVDGTWAGFGGYTKAKHAPVSVQNEKARQLWAGGAGRSHWRSCL